MAKKAIVTLNNEFLKSPSAKRQISQTLAETIADNICNGDLPCGLRVDRQKEVTHFVFEFD